MLSNFSGFHILLFFLLPSILFVECYLPFLNISFCPLFLINSTILLLFCCLCSNFAVHWWVLLSVSLFHVQPPAPPPPHLIITIRQRWLLLIWRRLDSPWRFTAGHAPSLTRRNVVRWITWLLKNVTINLSWYPQRHARPNRKGADENRSNIAWEIAVWGSLFQYRLACEGLDFCNDIGLTLVEFGLVNCILLGEWEGKMAVKMIRLGLKWLK